MIIKLASLGWDDERASGYARYNRPDLVPGRASRVDQGVCSVLTGHGLVRASVGGAVLTAAAADLTALPCVGDWVLLLRWPDRRMTVELVLPRRSSIIREGADGGSDRLIAANLDAVVIVDPPVLRQSGPSGGLAGRVDPTLCEVPVVVVDGRRREAEDTVRQLVSDGRTLGLVGPDRGRRADLIRGLMGMSALAVGSPRTARRAAVHCLIPVPGGGTVLDLPGVTVCGSRGGSRHTPGFARVRDGRNCHTPWLQLAAGAPWAPDLC